MKQTGLQAHRQKELHDVYYTPYWLKVRRLTALLILIWIVAILLVVIGAPLIELSVYGIPLAYWLISSVLLPGFLMLVVFYAWKMDRIESAILQSKDQNKNADQATESAIDPRAGDKADESQPARGPKRPV